MTKDTQHPHTNLLLLTVSIHPLPTTWYSPLSQGEKVDARLLQEHYEYIHTATADCPPETGGTRSEATEGVDKKTLTSHPSPFISHLSSVI